MLNKKLKVLVFGGNGFIGQAVVKRLHSKHVEVMVGTRALNRELLINERRIEFHNANLGVWLQLIEECDVVINCVGILRQRRGETYDAVHHQAVRKMAYVCQNLNKRLIHVSALGLYEDVKSRFLISKRHGEQALFCSQADWYLVRPSLLEGKHGFGARWMRRVARWPIHLTPANAKGRIAPIQVADLAAKIVDIALLGSDKKIHEVGGEKVFHFKQYLRHLSPKKRALHIPVPGSLVRLFSHLFDVLNLTPLSFGHYELMKQDNLPSALAQIQAPIVHQRPITKALSM